MKKLLIAVVVFALPLLGHADEFPAIERAIFGINLGETEKSLLRKCYDAGIVVDERPCIGRDHPGKVWAFKGTLNKNEEVRKTEASIFNGQVYEVKVIFRDGSNDFYEGLRKKLASKYGKPTIVSAWWGKYRYKANFGGEPVYILVDRDCFLVEQTSIAYSYRRLADKVTREMEARKAKRIAEADKKVKKVDADL